jgi:Protein of unknown function (DUF1656)
MTEEINFAGVFVPTFVVACIVALGLGIAMSKMLARVTSPDFRRFVWHAPLFDFCFYVIFVGISYCVLGTLLS